MSGASVIDDVHNYCDKTNDLRLFFSEIYMLKWHKLLTNFITYSLVVYHLYFFLLMIEKNLESTMSHLLG